MPNPYTASCRGRFVVVSRSFSRVAFSRLVALLIILSMLSASTPAAPSTIISGSTNLWRDVRFQVLSSRLAIDLPNFLSAILVPGSKRPKSSDQHLTSIKIYPGSITVVQGSISTFSAVGFDAEGHPIHGLAFEWIAIDTEGRTPPRDMLGGTFEAKRRGTFKVQARGSVFVDEVDVTVIPQTTPPPSGRNNPTSVNVSSRTRPRSTRTELSPKSEPKVENVQAATQMLIDEGGWNDGNWGSLDDPGNTPGNPPGGPADDGAGNGNFQISAPVAALPGRGLDLALSLNYNSRLWNKSGSQMTYDIDKGSPAPGWSLGFGKMIYTGSQGGCMLVDADGTRHGYAGSITPWAAGFRFQGRTTDGTFIDYGCSSYTGNSASGSASLPNGLSISYENLHGIDQLVPVRITDAQGNYINITYKNLPGDPVMETITDTLGRVITFGYDSANRITKVFVPQIGSSQPRTAVIIQYKEIALNYSFGAGMNAVVRDPTPHVIEAIYYPGTNTGYWFGDSDSYSSYGMISKVVEHRGMSLVNNIVLPGTMTKQEEYNYPLTTTNAIGRTIGVGLTDAPTYESLTENWAGADVVESAVTTYKIQSNASPRTTTVIQPNGKVSRQYSYNSPGQYNDGLVYSDETYVPDANGTYTLPNVPGTFSLVGKSNVSWASGNYSSPRPIQTEVFDENGDKMTTQYTYGSGKFNQVTRSCDYDNGGSVLRCSNAEYENSTDYIGNFDASGWLTSGGRHIFNLVKRTEVEDAQGTRVSRTEYEYDNYTGNALRAAPGAVQHFYWYDPYTTAQNYGACIQWGYYECGDPYNPIWCEDCYEWEMVSAYDPSTEKRGNVTKVTTYADAQNLTGAVIESRSYDKTGNLVRVSSACCEETSITYDDPGTTGIDSQYAYPFSQTRGSADPSSPHRITTYSNYDYRTGLLVSITDQNGRTSTNDYETNTLRLSKATASTGAYSTTSYDDSAMTVTEEVKEANGTLAGKTVKYLNGVGQVRKEESFAPNSAIDIVETKYTKFGEEWKQSRPYRTGDTVYWSERFYDLQGRLIKIVEPDGSETKAFYNESGLPDSVTNQPGSRLRVMDAWGRERWGRRDQQGRLIQVVEPNPDASSNPTGSVFASGSLKTTYSYDTLGRLIQSDQGGQLRKFKYDSLGRLTRQKLAEQTATLNDAGDYVGAGQAGANWANAFVYDGRSNLTKKTDARGVKSVYSFELPGGGQDPLNRLQSLSYNHSGPLDTSIPVHQSQPTAYSYMTSGDKTRIQSITTQNILFEEFSYDVEGRVIENAKTVHNRPTRPFTTNYVYDSLDRVKEVYYPRQYGIAGDPQKVVTHAYDTAGRLSGMTVGGQTAVSGVEYNSADQTTSIDMGTPGTNQVTEEYAFDPQTGLLTNQKAIRNGSELLNLSYSYNRENSVGLLNGKTGHLTKIVDNLEVTGKKNREYEFDALGRLTKAKGGVTGTLWSQTYTYDRFGNRTSVSSNGVAADNSPVTTDGIPNLTYNTSNNRINTSGFEYDVNGNQIRALAEDGISWVKYEYDSANRLRRVLKDDASQTLLQQFEYGADNARLLSLDAQINQWSIYASIGGTVLAEYTEFTSNTPTWVKSYTYLGDSQLSTITPNGQGGENVEYNHPDRLGTRTITNQQGGTSFEQTHLPFGTALNGESTVTNNNRRFTSYDRSTATGLDYALNRTYDSKLGRFTQVDPIGIDAASLVSPQTLNMYSYCGNDPINYTDPSGLFFGKLFKWIWKVVKVVAAVVFAVLAVLAFSIGQVQAGVALAMASAGIFADVFKITALQKLVRIASIALSIYRVHTAPLRLTPGTFPGSFAPDCPPNCPNIVLPEEIVVVAATTNSLGFVGAIVKFILKNLPKLWGWIKSAAKWTWNKAKEGWKWVKRKWKGGKIDSVDDVFDDPWILKGKSPADVEKAIGNTPGWRIENLRHGANEGGGWVLREYNAVGNMTGRHIRWNPGSTHHPGGPYWRVIGRNGDIGGVIR